jgi:hypothetical protein
MPGNAKPTFRTVSKSMMLLGIGECDYAQEQEAFQDRPVRIAWGGMVFVSGLSHFRTKP